MEKLVKHPSRLIQNKRLLQPPTPSIKTLPHTISYTHHTHSHPITENPKNHSHQEMNINHSKKTLKKRARANKLMPIPQTNPATPKFPGLPPFSTMNLKTK